MTPRLPAGPAAPTSARPGEGVLPGTLRYFETRPTAANVVVRDFSPPERWRRAALAWAACWGAAVAAVFLPVLHFVLVPALLIAGPVVARRRLGERRVMLSVSGSCPACLATIVTRLPQAPPATHRLRCDACGRAIELHPEGTEPGT